MVDFLSGLELPPLNLPSSGLPSPDNIFPSGLPDVSAPAQNEYSQCAPSWNPQAASSNITGSECNPVSRLDHEWDNPFSRMDLEWNVAPDLVYQLEAFSRMDSDWDTYGA